MQSTISIFKRSGVQKKRRPKLEDFETTMKLVLKNKVSLTGLIITSVYFILALMDYVYPQYLGAGPGIVTSMTRFNGGFLGQGYPQGPTLSGGWWYYLGTTYANIPLFPAILSALYIDLGYSLLIVLSGAIIGIFVGTISAYYGGFWDELMMRITDIFYSIPFLIMAIAFTTILSYSLAKAHAPINGFSLIALALIIIWWPTYARLTRSITLSIKSSRFIEAAIASGSSKLRNIFVHVIPNVLSPVFVQISLDLGSIVLIFATVEYLGLGNVIRVTQYTPELGELISQGQTYLPFGIWWPVFVPGLFLLIFTVGVNILGDGLRDVLDPKMRR